MKKEVHIQLFRIISMLMIILCHICNESSNTLICSLGQLFNVGVFCFLFISGYLFSNKTIDNYEKWIVKRLKKILVPFYIFVIFIFFINLIQKNFQPYLLIVYMFNMQYYFEMVPETSHLWFLTIIMLCYFSVPFLKKVEKKISLNYILIILLFLSIPCSYIYFKLGFTLMYFFAFTFGYQFAKIEGKTKDSFFKSIFIMGIAVLIRLISKKAFDNNPIYNVVLFSITHLLLSVGIYLFVKCITNFFQIKENKIIHSLDSLSFYLYITHYMFISKPFELLTITRYYWLNLLIALLCSYYSAVILEKIDKWIQKKLLFFSKKKVTI